MQSASFWNKRSFFRILCALNFDGGISISISCNTVSLAQFGNIFALHACIQVKLRPKTKKTMPNQQLQTRMGMARTNANLQSILQKRTFPCSHVHTFPNTNTTTSLRQITKHTNKKKTQNFDQLPVALYRLFPTQAPGPNTPKKKTKLRPITWDGETRGESSILRHSQNQNSAA